MIQKSAVVWLVLLIGLGSCSTAFRHGQSSFDEGLALFHQGDFRAAIPYFHRATDEDPNFGQAYLYLGRSYLSLRLWREAIQPLRTAYRLSPERTQHEVFELLMDAFLAAGLGTLDRAGVP